MLSEYRTSTSNSNRGRHRQGKSQAGLRMRSAQSSSMARLRRGGPGTAMHASSIDFGVMRNRREFLSMSSLDATSKEPARHIALLLGDQSLEIYFSLPRIKRRDREFQCRVALSQVKAITHWRDPHGHINLLIELRLPPVLKRKKHDAPMPRYDDAAAQDKPWSRQVSTSTFAEKDGGKEAQEDIDMGKWLAYRLVLPLQDKTLVESLCSTLGSRWFGQHMTIVQERHVDVVSHVAGHQWDWLRPSRSVNSMRELQSSLEAMQLDASTTYLPFEVAYQLEVCFSHGYLHPSNLSSDFVNRLGTIIPPPPTKPTAACQLLARAAASQRVFDDPNDIFSLPKNSTTVQNLPSYCTMIRSATVTPTTIYFHSPLVDTSNRILRKYKYVEDRFLRVRFRDELYRGKLWPEMDSDEVFERIRRVMLDGIEVGQRRFEFLAFGNSQFREHGAYFFAPTYDLSAEDIRKDMGVFADIKIVAKYAARLGQSFSTTRTTTNSVQITSIPDIYHKGYCFTDGVGKISLFMAQMIAQDMRLPTSASQCPSVYQFRLAGCKGVIAVDPQVKGAAVHIRPSQNKFPAKHQTLDICRYSRFSAAFLNQLIILILSALGVDDEVFLARTRTMLVDLEATMTDETVALRMLQRSVDVNHTTVLLASLISDGFMATREPFFVTCMRLWRSWSVKYLQEKARILVDQGAFLLGCVDERNVLRGHVNLDSDRRVQQNIADLPEIFVQISVYDAKSPSKVVGFKVIQGVCIVARNPALHPGDIRVVMASDKPELHHLRDVVVFAQSGDRDIPSMCSGGDLDGDDFLVIWDPDMIPKEWNFPAMDYTPPEPVTSDGPITLEAVIDFFVQHMKYDNLGRIATAHRYWADQLPKGVKDEKCLRLAALHSRAVDYAKTGVPAIMTRDLQTTAWPHWAGAKHIPQKKVYHSKKILGQLYDEVKGVAFMPAWELPFDDRILSAFDIADNVKQAAAQLKTEYDSAIRQVMSTFEIQTEFEVWTGFVMQHNQDSNDYKLAEKLGNTIDTIKQQYQELAYERAGTDERERSSSKMGPFIAAMYAVTASEVAAARTVSTLSMGAPPSDASAVPLMSFPWLFLRELGLIANEKFSASSSVDHAGSFFSRKSARSKPVVVTSLAVDQQSAKDDNIDQTGRADVDEVLPELEELDTLELPRKGWSITGLVSKSGIVAEAEDRDSSDAGRTPSPWMFEQKVAAESSIDSWTSEHQTPPRKRTMPGTFFDCDV